MQETKRNPPINGRISGLWEDIKVNPPLGITPLLLPDQEQSHPNPRLQPAAQAPNLRGRHSIRVDPEPLRDLKNNLVAGNVPLGHEPEPLLHDPWPGWSLVGDNPLGLEPGPELLDGRRRRLSSRLERGYGEGPVGREGVEGFSGEWVERFGGRRKEREECGHCFQCFEWLWDWRRKDQIRNEWVLYIASGLLDSKNYKTNECAQSSWLWTLISAPPTVNSTVFP